MQIKKKEVERLLGCNITDGQFEEALGFATRKQEQLYKHGHKPAVLQPWYLARLTEEYVRALAFSRLTMDICMEFCNMEKEHQTRSQGAPTHNHIVAFPSV